MRNRDKNTGATDSKRRALLKRLEREYRAGLAEIDARGDANPFASVEEMRETIGAIYLGSIHNLRRALGIA